MVDQADQDVDAPTGLAASFMANRQQLNGFLRARFGNWADGSEVEDIMQELWLRSRAIDPAGIGNPRSYLFRMAHNLVLNRARDTTRRRNHEAEWGYVHGCDRNGVVDPVAERGLLARERLDTINKALSGAGERAARIFRRYRIDGIDQRHIAAELDVSLSTVERDLRAAYAAISTLEERSDDE